MDALFAMNRAGFQQLVAHVSLYHSEPSPGFRAVASESLATAGLEPSRFTIWDVKGMGQLLGKALPLDIHGNHVIFDEAGLSGPDATHGMLRYGFLAAAVRAKSGGRQRYDYLTMNATIALGTLGGLGFLLFGRRRWGMMKRRPLVAIGLSTGVCVLTMGFVRAGFKVFNVGMLMAERSHERALQLLKCPDCIGDVLLTSEQQIHEMETATLPAPQPGMPPPPEEYVRAWKRGMETQTMLVKRDVLRMKVLLRRAESGPCSVHTGLRNDPQGFDGRKISRDGEAKAEVSPIFRKDRDLAAARVAGTLVIDTSLNEDEKRELQRMKLEYR